MHEINKYKIYLIKIKDIKDENIKKIKYQI